MSETLSLSGHEYIPATAAGKRFGYTSDYITMLARQGHIEATKVGHQWFVIESSVQDFINHKTKEKDARANALRAERKAELTQYQKAQVEEVTEAKQKHHLVALMETLVILVIGLSLGASGYVMTTPDAQTASLSSTSYSAVERLALSLYTFVSGSEKTVTYTAETTNPTPIQNGASAAVSVALGTTTHTTLIVAPNEVMTATTVESIRDSFSDDVAISVDPEHPDTGIIVPQFREKEGEAYRFLLVPLETGSTGSEAQNTQGNESGSVVSNGSVPLNQN